MYIYVYRIESTFRDACSHGYLDVLTSYLNDLTESERKSLLSSDNGCTGIET